MPPTSTVSPVVVVGKGEYRYQALPAWEQLPEGWDLIEVPGVAVDSSDNVYVFNRGEHPVVVFDRQGRFLRSWGEGVFRRPHGIVTGPDDSIYCTDDLGHCVRKFTPDGRLLATLGTPDAPSDTGISGMDYRTIRRPAGPFNMPTNVAFDAAGNIYVCDGYGNARVHRFDPAGRLLASWGTSGDADGAFNLPHGITVGLDGRVYVADRENSRVQVFTAEGRFLAAWTDVARPMQVAVDARGNVLVAAVGWRTGTFPWQTAPSVDPTGARLSVFDPDGRLLARGGDDADPWALGNYFAPHDLAIDSRGDVYVGEVTVSANGGRLPLPADYRPLKKLVRQ